jgi:hypothetical protein
MLDKLKHIVVVMMGLPRGPAPGGATREPVRSPAELGPMCTSPSTSSPLIRPRASSLAGSRVRLTVTCTSKSASRRRRRGDRLIIEPICQGRSALSAEACGDLCQSIAIPRKGESVPLIGDFAYDTQHDHLEFHPVVTIEPLNPGECARGPR